VPAFRLSARIVGVLAAALFLKKAIVGFVSGTISRGSWQFRGVDAYLYCAWYAFFLPHYCALFLHPRYWKRLFLSGRQLSSGCLFVILAIAIAFRLSTH